MTSKRAQRKRSPGLSWAAFRLEWERWYSSKRSILGFGIKFGSLIVLLYILLAQPFLDKILYSYLETNAAVSNLILNKLGQNTRLADVTIQSARFAMAIRRGCDALEPTWLYCAALLAFPGSFVPKAIGMLFGAVALQLLNLLRIVTLFLIGVHFPAVFDSAHMEIWPSIFIIIPIVLFLVWKDWAFEVRKPHAKP